MNNQQNKKSSLVDGVDKIVDGYHLFMENMHAWLEKADEQAGPMLIQGLDEVKQFLHDLGQWTETEVELISDYVKRDIHDIATRLERNNQTLAQWLEFDSQKIEKGFFEILESMADHTRMELDRLQHLAQEPHLWHTGEVTSVGTLSCVSCGKQLHYHKPGRIPPCPKCHHTEFYRKDKD